MMNENLYREELVLISEAKTQGELFQEVGGYLFEKNLVTDGFTQAIFAREKAHPTGIDLSVVANHLPNVALPHTEAKYCKEQVVAFVKLRHLLSFYHMIQPAQSLEVRYLFFIINPLKGKQSMILGDLMEFITNPEHLKHLETLTTTKEIYNYLSQTQRMNIK